jgi:hypothetical protein
MCVSVCVCVCVCMYRCQCVTNRFSLILKKGGGQLLHFRELVQNILFHFCTSETMHRRALAVFVMSVYCVVAIRTLCWWECA